MAFYQLIYRSIATRLPGDEELARMVEQARINNYSQGITGALFYAEGRFLQVLEGAREPVEALYEYIRHDPRHTEVVRLFGAASTQRLFPHWSLGFGQVSAPALAGLQARLGPEHLAALRSNAHDVAVAVAEALQEFVRGELVVARQLPWS
ncbi:MAG: hypothetical protein JWP58_929 [Hymenobacter sp.]|nr:hypothetical protein [Hymenobacter sp.]